MNLRYCISGIAFSCAMFAISGCGEKHKSEVGHFTKVDSVTETYLNLKDAMLETWNRMINDDNQKIKAMYNLLHELKVSDPSHRDEYELFEERLDHLEAMRYTQKSMENGQVVEEYDFASNS